MIVKSINIKGENYKMMSLFKELGKVEKLKIYVLAEDHAGYDSLFWAQFGTSFLISCETGEVEKNILFDAAIFAEPIVHNMKLLELDPKKDISMIALSHCHFDHTAGLVGILKEIGKQNIPIIAHPSIFRTVIEMESGLWPIGLTTENTKESIEKEGGKWILTKEPVKLAPGVVTSGEIERNFEKKVTLDSYNLEAGRLVKDEILDDTSLYLNMKEGLVIVASCSHAGIVNIVKQGIKLTGEKRVRAVIGGYHLIDADEERIKMTIKALKDLGVKKIFTGHCTGLKAEAAFLDAFGENFEGLYSGKVMKF
jgi:7,8-dihydropterin-6-yl-methyl-4-(beta-D-ribofuranosyl)aminobenzene 5'-phosphate synthase